MSVLYALAAIFTGIATYRCVLDRAWHFPAFLALVFIQAAMVAQFMNYVAMAL